MDREQTCEASRARKPQRERAQSSAEIYQDVYNGWKWWHVYCYRCHGQDALGTTLAPNLTDPNIKFTLAGVSEESSQRIPRQRNASLGQASRRQADHSALLLRHGAVPTKCFPPGRPDEVGPKGGRWVPPQGWPKSK